MNASATEFTPTSPTGMCAQAREFVPSGAASVASDSFSPPAPVPVAKPAGMPGSRKKGAHAKGKPAKKGESGETAREPSLERAVGEGGQANEAPAGRAKPRGGKSGKGKQGAATAAVAVEGSGDDPAGAKAAGKKKGGKGRPRKEGEEEQDGQQKAKPKANTHPQSTLDPTPHATEKPPSLTPGSRQVLKPKPTQASEPSEQQEQQAKPKANRKGRGKGKEEQPPAADKQRKGDSKGSKGGKGGRKWWRDLEGDDPISLDPLSQLRYEPFQLPADDSVVYYFDGHVLALYLVASGNFTHPVSRRVLTRDELIRLDTYLKLNKLKAAHVTRVFDSKEAKQEASSQASIDAIQLEAENVLASLFEGIAHQKRVEFHSKGHSNAHVVTSTLLLSSLQAPPTKDQTNHGANNEL